MRAELDRSWQAVTEPRGNGIVLSTEKLRLMSDVAFRLLEWLKPMGFTADQTQQIANALDQPAGQVIQSATHRIVHERFGWLLEPSPEPLEFTLLLTEWPDEPVDVPGLFKLTVDLLDNPIAANIPGDSAIALLDADQLVFPLTVRPWKQGDKLRPLGLNGHKLVSDLLNDLKLSRREREQTVVLLSGNEIVWIVGRRIGHRFRITDRTRRVVRLGVIYP
jgi:tRNA(Ile)-lysidine synthase